MVKRALLGAVGVLVFSQPAIAERYPAYQVDYQGRTADDLVVVQDGIDDWYIDVSTSLSGSDTPHSLGKMPWVDNTALKHAFPSEFINAIDFDKVLSANASGQYSEKQSVISGLSTSDLGTVKYDVCLSDLDGDQTQDYLFLPRQPQSDAKLYITPSTATPADLVSYNPFFLDASGDGVVDLFLQSLEPQENSFFLTGTGTGCFAIQQQMTDIDGVLLDAQNASIEVSSRPVPGKQALVINGSIEARTDSQGNFSGPDSLEQIEEIPEETRLVGDIPYQLEVSPAGAALIKVPIAVPASITGFGPDVSFIYSSHAGTGHLGTGWSIGGLSSIHRCPKSTAVDGEPSGIEFDEEGAVCLDGKRLIKVSQTEEVIEYRPRINDFSRVIYDRAESFFVRIEKDGAVSFFGATGDSAWEATGRTEISVWAMNQKRDKFGNGFEIVYFENSSTGERHVESIAFDEVASGYRDAIDFTYEDGRMDARESYLAGSKNTVSKRLVRVSVTSNDQLYREYTVEYDAAIGHDGRSRIEKIVERDPSGKTRNLGFSWDPDVSPSFVSVPTNIEKTNAENIKVLDINNDGKEDLLRFSPDSLAVHLGTKDGLNDQASCNGALSSLTPSKVFVLDYDGDGLEELIETASWQLLKIDASCSVISQQLPTPEHGSARSNSFFDINGDGLDDYMSKDYHIYINEPDNGFTYASSISPSLTNLGGPRLLDTNGDGRTDFLRDLSYAYNDDHDGLFRLETWLSTGDDYFRSSKTDRGFNELGNGFAFDGFEWAHYESLLADINGDGLKDHLTPMRYWPNSNIVFIVQVYKNKGDGSFTRHEWGGQPQLLDGLASPAFSIDYDGDGLEDVFGNNWGSSFVALKSSVNAAGEPTLSKATVSGIPSSLLQNLVTFIDYDGDGDRDFLIEAGGTHFSMLRHERVHSRKIVTIRSGAGEAIIDYKHISEGRYGIGGRRKVVDRIKKPDGLGGIYEEIYSFSDYQYDPAYRRELGFRTVSVEEPRIGLVKTTKYDLSAKYGSTPVSVTETVNGKKVSEYSVTDFDYLAGSSGQVVFRYVKESSTTRYDYTSEEMLSTEEASMVYKEASMGPYGDSLGQLESSQTTTTDEFGTYIQKTEYDLYDSDVLAASDLSSLAGAGQGAQVWRSLPESITSTSQLAPVSGDGSTRSEVVTREYYANGAVERETRHPGTVYETITEYGYSAEVGSRGLPTSVTVRTESGHAFPQRVESNSYELQASGDLLITSTNAENHVNQTLISSFSGRPAYRIDANDIRTDYQYDGLGRLAGSQQSVSAPDVIIERGYCNDIAGQAGMNRPICLPGEYDFESTRTTDSSQAEYVFRDVLRREVRKARPAVNGQYIYQRTEYNAQGRVARVSLPYTAGTTPQWTDMAYDAIGRLKSESKPDGTGRSRVYNGFETVFTDEKGHPRSRTKNAIGQLVKAKDAEGHQIRYRYDASGQLRYVSDPAGNPVIIEYDDAGNRTALYDPDLTPMASYGNRHGGIYFEHDALGQLVLKKAPEGLRECYVYDRLGRKVKRIDGYVGSLTDALNGCAGTYPQNQVAEFTYDIAAGDGIGQIASVTGANGYAEVYEYHADNGHSGRIKSVTTTLELGHIYATSYTYDAFGRVDEQTYPGGDLTVRHTYNAVGQLVGLENAANDESYWRVEEAEVDAFGMPVSETLGETISVRRSFHSQTGRLSSIEAGAGSGDIMAWHYGYDDAGNIETKEDRIFDVTEIYGYDSLNRITSVTVNGAAGDTVQYDPGGLGNIIAKTGVGAYRYGADAPADYDQQCRQIRPGPHAVVATEAANDSNYYCYDKAGNMVRRGDTYLDYASFRKPIRIDKADSLTEFVYGPERQRIKRTDTIISGADQSTITTRYIQGQSERIETVDGSRMVHYVAGVAVVSISEQSTETSYLLRDYQETISAVVSADGSKISYQRFDAWGAASKAYPLSVDHQVKVLVAGITRKGFTGQEAIASSGFIHMNARVYDPRLAMFTSPDPVVQAPDNSLSLNRYAYVLGSPATLIDPTGYSAEFPADLSIDFGGPEATLGAIADAYTLNFSMDPFQLGGTSSNYGALGSPGADIFSDRSFAGGSLPEVGAVAPAELGSVQSPGHLSTEPQVQSFWSYFSDRLKSGVVRDDIFTYGGSLVHAFTFGLVEPSFMDKSSSAYDIGQGVSLFLGGSGAVRATYMVGWRGASALAANTNSRRLALSLSSARNAEKLISNPALLLDAAQRAKHVVPALERLRQQGGSIRSLMIQVGKTNAYYNRRLIPLTPFMGAASNDDWGYSRMLP